MAASRESAPELRSSRSSARRNSVMASRTCRPSLSVTDCWASALFSSRRGRVCSSVSEKKRRRCSRVTKERTVMRSSSQMSASQVTKVDVLFWQACTSINWRPLLTSPSGTPDARHSSAMRRAGLQAQRRPGRGASRRAVQTLTSSTGRRSLSAGVGSGASGSSRLACAGGSSTQSGRSSSPISGRDRLGQTGRESAAASTEAS